MIIKLLLLDFDFVSRNNDGVTPLMTAGTTNEMLLTSGYKTVLIHLSKTTMG